jgi:nitroimidazol reductase NimA-like FMN-containing flavoprotein (pyridoxamine 5'-phosphate oxidase superfamily)
MYGDLTAEEIDALLRRHRYARLGFTFNAEVYIIPINYAYDGARLYGQAPAGHAGYLPGGTKVAGMRQHDHVALQVDEIEDPAHWRSVLLHGRFHELHGPTEKRATFERISQQAGGGDRSEVSYVRGIDELVHFTIEIVERHGRYEQREAYQRQPAPHEPLPPVSAPPTWDPPTGS